MLARMRALDPFRADLLLAAVYLVEALGELVLLVPGDAEHRWAVVLLLCVGAFTVAIRRRQPAIAALVGVPVQIAAEALGPDYIDHLVSPFFVILLVLYGIGRHLEGRLVPVLGAYSVAVLWISELVNSSPDSVADFVFTAGLVVGAPILIGRVLRHRAQLNRT
jgi:hypothetical protein